MFYVSFLAVALILIWDLFLPTLFLWNQFLLKEDIKWKWWHLIFKRSNTSFTVATWCSAGALFWSQFKDSRGDYDHISSFFFQVLIWGQNILDTCYYVLYHLSPRLALDKLGFKLQLDCILACSIRMIRIHYIRVENNICLCNSTITDNHSITQ